MYFFYNIFISLLSFGMRLGSLFNAKIRKGWLGRKESEQKIKQKLSPHDKVIWMHAASLGEYEQGLPVLERLKQTHPQHKILITFFSPSGYENVANKPNIADVVCYLPLDKKKNLRRFLSLFTTDIFFTVKYDYWYHLFDELKKRNAKLFIISAYFYPKQIFFKRGLGNGFVSNLKRNINWIFHQNQASEHLAKSIGLLQSSVSGDTRFDRVKQILSRDNTLPLIDEFKDAKPLLIFGSSWQAEEKIAKAISSLHPKVKIIIAPQSLKRLEPLKSLFPQALLYSKAPQNQQKISDYSVLIIDSIGILSKLYSYADIAVVGGGFHSAGLHNILEATTFGMPVLFGNHYRKNPEADALISIGGAQSFKDENQTIAFLSHLIQNPQLIRQMSDKSKAFIASQPLATEHISHIISQNPSTANS